MSPSLVTLQQLLLQQEQVSSPLESSFPLHPPVLRRTLNLAYIEHGLGDMIADNALVKTVATHRSMMTDTLTVWTLKRETLTSNTASIFLETREINAAGDSTSYLESLSSLGFI